MTDELCGRPTGAEHVVGSGEAGSDVAAPVADVVRGCSLLENLSEQDLDAVLGATRVLRRSRGQALLRRGSTAVLILVSGSAKEHRGASEVEDVVLGLLGAGDVAGLPNALGRPREGDVTALAETRALLLPGGELWTLARTRPEVALAWLRTVTGQLHALRDQVVTFASTSASQRVMHRLVELAERFGEPMDGAVRLHPELTQEELGSWAGASRESTAKALHELRRAGIVRTRRRSLTILDLEALRRRTPAGTPPVSEPFTIDLTEAVGDATPPY